jgi:predicted enzyme related to lactoylglutathione lyase
MDHHQWRELSMTAGVNTIIYPVKDQARAKTLFSGLLGVEPSVDARYYVQFDVAGQQIGLDPNGHTHGMTPYWTVDDINATLQQLVEAGAETVQAVRDVGGQADRRRAGPRRQRHRDHPGPAQVIR